MDKPTPPANHGQHELPQYISPQATPLSSPPLTHQPTGQMHNGAVDGNNPAGGYYQQPTGQMHNGAVDGDNPTGGYYQQPKDQPQQQPQQQQQQGYPQGQQQGQQRPQMPIEMLQSQSAPVTCPSCGAYGQTIATPESGNFTHGIAALVCCVACLGCIPYCINSLKDVHHKCGNCGMPLATFHRSGRTEPHVFQQR